MGTYTDSKLSSCFCEGNLKLFPKEPLTESIDTINYSVCLPLAQNGRH